MVGVNHLSGVTEAPLWLRAETYIWAEIPQTLLTALCHLVSFPQRIFLSGGIICQWWVTNDGGDGGNKLKVQSNGVEQENVVCNQIYHFSFVEFYCEPSGWRRVSKSIKVQWFETQEAVVLVWPFSDLWTTSEFSIFDWETAVLVL